MGTSDFRDLPLTTRAFPHFPVTACILVVALVAGLSSQTASTPSLTLLAKDGRRSVPLAIADGQEMVALDDLAAAFQLTVREDALGALTVSYKGKTIVLTPDQALASVSGRLVSLPAPMIRGAGRRWMVPVEFISRALGLIYDARLELRKTSRLLLIGDVRVPRITARYEPLGAAGRLTIDATPRATSTVTQDGDRLSIKFDADALDAQNPLIAAPGPQALVQSVRVGEGTTTVVVDLAPRLGGFRSAAQPGDTSSRLVIDLMAPADTAAPSPQAPPAAQPAPPAPSTQPTPDVPFAFGQQPSALHTIAIDPGHGGEDEGVKSATGVKEKDVTLALARRTKAAIEARLGLRVLLTRDDDRNVPLDDRASLANNNKADLFISLHVNGSMRPSTTGATVFLAAFDKDAARTADTGGIEKLPTFGGGLRDVELVPWDLAQTRHLDRSEAFAALLQQLLQQRVPLAPRAIDRAPLRVLESANMPAVLIELGYLTNPEQVKLLTSDGFQNAAVQAMVEAVIRFRDSTTAAESR
jgi:N-acetylmuramoyl-L-alanine amidase